MIITSMTRFAFALFIALFGAPAVAEEPRLAGSWGDLHGEPLVPAVLGMWTDQTGSAWNVQDHGVLGRIGAGMMNSGEALIVEGETFACDTPLMTHDGGEWVFPANRLLHGLAVTRRVRLDRENGTMRYIEAFRNPGAGAITVTVELRTQYNGNIAEWRSDRGTLSPVTLREDEGGLVIQPAAANHDRLFVYALCGGPSVSRPALATPSRFALHVRYSVTVPAGESAFLLHGLAQRMPDAPLRFDLAEWSEALPANERARVVNLPSTELDDPRAQLLANVAAEWGEMPATDTLFLPGPSRLPGTFRAGQIALQTPTGEKRWELAEVVALELIGDGQARLFLRNGEAWRGGWKGEGVAFVPASGASEVAMTGERELRCVRGGVPVLRAWPEDVDGFLETQDGQRFALSSLGGSPAGFTSNWGAWKGTLDDVAAFEWKDGEPCLSRRDGTWVRAFPVEEAWTVETKAAGRVALPLTRVRRFVNRQGALPARGVEARLREGERLAADWTEAGIEVQGVALKPAAIRELRRTGDGSVRVKLWDGGVVEGPLAGGVIPLISGGKEFRLGLREVDAVLSHAPDLTEAERSAMTSDIARLGAADWKEREAATQRLAALGERAWGELRTAFGSSGLDPEVRHRLQRLLGDEP